MKHGFGNWLLVAALAALVHGGAAAEDTPSAPVRVVIPFPPGGGTDNIGRLLAKELTVVTRRTTVVDNKPGAGGNLGMELVAKARPDGNTFGIGQTANLAISPSLYRQLAIDPQKDLLPVALISTQPNVVVVSAASGVRSLADLVKLGRSRPNGLALGSPGVGTIGHLAGEMLAKRAGLNLLHVPYKGTAPALNDLIAGQVDFILTTPSGVVGLTKSGKLRALAVTSPARIPTLPDVPTVAESGYAGFVAEDWKAVVAPVGTPDSAIQAMHSAVASALRSPEIRARLTEEGSTARTATITELSALIKTDTQRWGEIVRAIGARAD